MTIIIISFVVPGFQQNRPLTFLIVLKIIQGQFYVGQIKYRVKTNKHFCLVYRGFNSYIAIYFLKVYSSDCYVKDNNKKTNHLKLAWDITSELVRIKVIIKENRNHTTLNVTIFKGQTVKWSIRILNKIVQYLI